MSITIPDTLDPVRNSRYPHRPRVLFLLRRRPDSSAEAFERAVRMWRTEREQGFGFGSITARAGVAMQEEQEAISGLFRRSGTEVVPIDGYVSFDLQSYAPAAADFEMIFQAAEGCLDTLRDVIVPAESIAYAGIANLVIPGVAPTSMILILNRTERISLKEYNEWWVRHADDHRQDNPGQAGYHQLHIDPGLNAMAARAAGVSTSDCCIVDMMYVGRIESAFSRGAGRSAEEARRLSADITAHVSRASVSGSFMKEV